MTSAATTERREQGFREFKWWLGHPRLYRLVGFRWLCWRYRDLGVGIPDPRRAPQEAIDLGRELAREHGWIDDVAERLLTEHGETLRKLAEDD